MLVLVVEEVVVVVVATVWCSFYTLENLKPHLSVQLKNQKGLPVTERVNFDFGNSSKFPD